jgi:hypothetical protein
MGRCEDFPCCGHASGECPDIDSQGRERWRCVGGCGKRLPLTATSSICAKCQRRMNKMMAEGYYGSGREDH